MLAYLKGHILAHTKDGAIVATGATGHEVIGAWLGRKSVGDEVVVWTYEYLENQSIPRLVGCQSAEGRALLIELLGVNGVGPKMAGRILDAGSAAQIKQAITSGDLAFLGSVKGLGKKTAQKIVLELGKILVDATTTANAFLYDALGELKFTRAEIDRVLATINITDLSESEALAKVLQALGRRT